MKFLDNLTVKQKQRLLMVVVGLCFAGLLLFGSYISEKKKEEKVQEKVKATKKMTLLTDKVEKDLWIAAEGQNIKALEKSNEELRHQVTQLFKELEDTKRELKKKAEAPPKLPPIPPPAPKPASSEKGKDRKKEENLPEPDPEFPPPDEFSPQFTPPPKGSRVGERVKKPPEGPGASGGSAIRVFKDESPQKEKDPKEKKEERRGQIGKKEETTFIPSGSFMKAVILSGLDAPTSGTGKSEPYPVLFGVSDLSVLPNRFKMNLKECFIIGAGFGNLSDERAYIRTETLSCVRNDGVVIDVPLKGHVIGEDGKLGVRGRLVSKQGQKIAMALLAGTLASFSQAFRPQTATVLQLDPEKEANVFRYKPEDILTAGALGGVGNALNKVADYYLKLADRIFPIIEVDAGREVEIIVLKGQELKLQGGKI